MPFHDLEPHAAQAALQRDPGLRLLDVRTLREHKSHRLPHAVLVPVQELAQRLGELDAQAKWLVYCEHGRRSVAACQILQQAGFRQVTNLAGGVANWIGAGLPIER
ncbi:MAG TPA: rhodanese-like domain-containing protein [Planctomycetota bacterium]|nr:rhodanese-like domain-containing protein [Planctomycetota bacterium]